LVFFQPKGFETVTAFWLHGEPIVSPSRTSKDSRRILDPFDPPDRRRQGILSPILET